ncbi:hypothetical protein, partial [Geobacillus thermoleovorans]
MLKQLDLYIKKPKNRLINMLQEISSEKISLDSSLETVERIASLQYTALGEIYGINLVQIEHGLKWAMEQL